MQRNLKLSVFAVSALVAGANTAQAQTWTAMPTLTNTPAGAPDPPGAFWNKRRRFDHRRRWLQRGPCAHRCGSAERLQLVQHASRMVAVRRLPR